MKDLLRNKLILTTLGIWLVSSPMLWYSGILLGRGQEALAGWLYLAYTVLGLVDSIIYWKLIFDSKK